MKNTIDQFMWGYQQHFSTSVKHRFTDLAAQIGVHTVTPTVFLVGVANSNQARYLVCVEPEEGFRYDQKTFERLADEYKRARVTDPRAGMLQSHPVAQKNEEKGLHVRSIRNAILACIDAQDDGGSNVTFCSMPVPVGSYDICVLLQVPQEQIEACPTLVTAERRYSPVHVYPVMQSLVKAAAQVFLEACSSALWQPDVVDLECNVVDAAREAGRRLMGAPASLGNIGSSLDATSLFEACNVIAASRYEGAASRGGMLISVRGHEAVESVITLANPVPLRDHRGTRKLLELTVGGAHLLCDGRAIYGVGAVNATYDASKENLFYVRFTNHYEWQLIHHGTVLMEVEYGNPRLSRPPFDIEKFRRDLPRFFPGIGDEETARLIITVVEACGQSHGTTVIISRDAAEEADRLSGQATLIQPMLLSQEIVRMVTTVDGGILLAPDATCYAMGVILDGEATPKGNPSRGGRYNSAVRYTEANPGTVAIVVSADSSIDIVPDLRPSVPRYAIEGTIRAFSEMAEADSIKPGDYNVAVSRLDDVRFYLTAEDCARVNELVAVASSKVDYHSGGITISPAKFIPHPDFTPLYYDTGQEGS